MQNVNEANVLKFVVVTYDASQLYIVYEWLKS